MKLLTLLLNLLGCQHRNKGWPITRRSVCYQVCLDCGEELRYDWKKMQAHDLTTVEKRRITADHVGASS